MPRKSKEIKGSDLKYVFSIASDDVTLPLLRGLFADTEDGESRFSPQDKLSVPRGKAGAKSQTRTNLGRYMFNMFALEPLRPHVGYINDPLTQKRVSALIGEATDLMTEGKIIPDEYVDFMERMAWMGYSTVSFVAPGFGMDGVRLPPKAAALKKKLLEKNREALKRGDADAVSRVEKELLAAARLELKAKGSASLDYWDSGSRGNFKNNFKNMAAMRGLVADPQHPGKFLVGTSCLSDGTPPEDMQLGATVLIQGAGGRAVDTRKGGYMSKQLMASFQGLILGEDGSNCETRRCLTVKITSKNSGEFRLRYIVVNKKLVLLDSDMLKKFIGKTVQLRTPMFCRSPEVCEKCYGRLPYEIGIKNVGMTYNAIGVRLKGLSLKQMHDSTVQVGKIDLDSVIFEEK